MPTLPHTQAVAEWQDDLAAYGIARGVAKGLSTSSGGSPDFFGFTRQGTGYELAFAKDPTDLPSNTTLSVLAPDGQEPFDMLVTKDLQKAIEGKDRSTLRAFISRILDEV